MSGYIGVTVVGNVVANPELREVGRHKVCKFKLAANTGFGERKAVAFFTVDVWGRAGESVAKYLAKGKQTMVTGNLTVREYETKDGKKGVSLEIRASDVVFLGSADGQPKQEEQTPATPPPGIDSVPF